MFSCFGAHHGSKSEPRGARAAKGTALWRIGNPGKTDAIAGTRWRVDPRGAWADNGTAFSGRVKVLKSRTEPEGGWAATQVLVLLPKLRSVRVAIKAGAR